MGRTAGVRRCTPYADVLIMGGGAPPMRCCGRVGKVRRRGGSAASLTPPRASRASRAGAVAAERRATEAEGAERRAGRSLKFPLGIFTFQRHHKSIDRAPSLVGDCVALKIEQFKDTVTY